MSELNDCDCEGWRVNLPIVNAPFTMNLTAVGRYTGKVFTFCPWCGKDRRAPQGVGLTLEQNESVRVAAKALDRLASIVHISRLPSGAHAQSDINRGSIAAAKIRAAFPSVFAPAPGRGEAP